MRHLDTRVSPRNYAGPKTERRIYEVYGDDGYKEYWVETRALDGSVKATWKYGFKTYDNAKNWAGIWPTPSEYFNV